MEATYKKILTLLKKHENEIVFDVDELRLKANNHLFGIELKNTYGLNIEPKNVDSTTAFKASEHFYICVFG